MHHIEILLLFLSVCCCTNAAPIGNVVKSAVAGAILMNPATHGFVAPAGLPAVSLGQNKAHASVVPLMLKSHDDLDAMDGAEFVSEREAFDLLGDDWSFWGRSPPANKEEGKGKANAKAKEDAGEKKSVWGRLAYWLTRMKELTPSEKLERLREYRRERLSDSHDRH